jgi:hypothetical protein
MQEEADYLKKAETSPDFPQETSRVRDSKQLKDEPRMRESYGGIP